MDRATRSTFVREQRTLATTAPADLGSSITVQKEITGIDLSEGRKIYGSLARLPGIAWARRRTNSERNTACSSGVGSGGLCAG